jgi:hypothetical protein
MIQPRLELETAFAGGLGQRLDAAVILEARAVESDLLDAGSLGALGNQLATSSAAALLPPFATWARTSASTVEAAASTLEPQPEMICA